MDDAKLVAALGEIKECKKAVAKQYASGLLTREEVDSQLHGLQFMFRDALCELGLRDVHARNRDTMERFELDYRAWAQGSEPRATDGEPWLLRAQKRAGTQAETSESAHPDAQPLESEASPGERAAYFQLAAEALLEITAIDFPPDDMEKPVRHIKVYGNGTKVVVPFDCADDGGLAACDDPRGKRFTLTASNGLHATIAVDARAGVDYRPVWDAGSQFHGLISIEGYTVDDLRCVGGADMAEGRVASVTYCNAFGTDDWERNEEAFQSFPRWQAFFEWERAHRSRLLSPSREDCIRALLNGASS